MPDTASARPPRSPQPSARRRATAPPRRRSRPAPREARAIAAPRSALPAGRAARMARRQRRRSVGALSSRAARRVGTREPWRERVRLRARVANPATESGTALLRAALHALSRERARDAGDEGLITGYYEPLLRGSRKPTGATAIPLYGVPDDLVVVDLGELYPELKDMRLRGRLEGRRLVPYSIARRSRAAQAPLRGKEIAWVDDAIDLFFLHIQGSGRIVARHRRDDARRLRRSERPSVSLDRTRSSSSAASSRSSRRRCRASRRGRARNPGQSRTSS